MKCAECRWWNRFTVPEWAAKQGERWAEILTHDPYRLDTGECGRPYGEGFSTRLLSIELDYSLYTRSTFGCVQFEKKS